MKSFRAMKSASRLVFLASFFVFLGVACSDEEAKTGDEDLNVNSNNSTNSSNNATNNASNNSTNSSNNVTNNMTTPSCVTEELALIASLDAATTDTDFTLLMRCDGGGEFSHSIGGSTATKDYESASTSKWVTAAVILRLVDKGILSLSDQPQDYISFWTSDAASPLSRITLDQLLSFTSGLEDESVCSNLAGRDYEACVETIYDINFGAPVEPGTGFFYANTHLQVAGLMAMKATGKSTWGEVFADFQTETGLFPNGIYDLPSEQNPRVAGGMHWRADEYLDFLEAFYRGDLLSSGLQDMVVADHTAGAETKYSPALEGVGQDWHYGFGFWLECASTSYNCTGISRISSPGAYGAYPYIDYEAACVGMLAREGALASYTEGKKLVDSVQNEIDAWTACQQ
jgi:hypothetical protein